MIPAAADEIRRELGLLSTGTNPRREHEGETRMSFELLVAGLKDVPLDILKDGCQRYMTAPGKRFFPRSAGELLAFTNGPMTMRMRRAWRIAEMLKDVTEREQEAAARELADRSWTPESVEEANAEFRSVGLKTRYRYIGDGRCETIPPA